MSTDAGLKPDRIRRPAAHVPALLAISLVGALAGCAAGNEAEAVERVDSAGVEIVRSPGADRPLEWTFTERFALGGAEEGPETFYHVWPRSVGADDLGRIHVLDTENHRVVTFDRDGGFLRERGREGGGPGELESPATLSVESSGDLSVFDYGKMALVRWDSAGELLSRLRFPHPPMIDSRHHALMAGGYLVSTWGLVDGERANRLLAVAGEDTTLVSYAPQPDRGVAMFEECGGGINFPPLFTRAVVWDHRDGTTAVVPGADYRIDLYRDGRLVRSVRRRVPVRTATRELAVAEAGEGFTVNFGNGPCTVPPERYVEYRGFAETVPAIRGLLLGPDGGLWVERWVPGADPMPVDRFGPDGDYLGTLPAGTPLPVLVTGDGRVGVVRVDELDVARLVVGDGEG